MVENLPLTITNLDLEGIYLSTDVTHKVQETYMSLSELINKQFDVDHVDPKLITKISLHNHQPPTTKTQYHPLPPTTTNYHPPVSVKQRISHIIFLIYYVLAYIY